MDNIITNLKINSLTEDTQISIFENEFTNFKQIQEGFILESSITDKIGKLKDILVKFFKGLVEKIKEFFKNLKDKIKALFSKIKIKGNKILREDGISDLSLTRCAKYFKLDYKGEEVVFGEFPFGNPLKYFEMNSRGTFDIYQEKIRESIARGSDLNKIKEGDKEVLNKYIEKLNKERELIKENSMHYMLSNGQKTSEGSFTMDLVNFYTGKDGRLALKEVTTSNIEQYCDELDRVAFRGKKWFDWIDESYQDMMRSINKYKESAETALESSESAYVSAITNYISTCTNMSLSIINAGSQIHNHWRNVATTILQKVLTKYASLTKSV
jgi:predicted RNase H-like HicB family nuclease